MRPGSLLFWMFVCIPIIEIYILVQVGAIIGGWSVVGLTILSAMLGSYLVRTQGMMTAQRVQQAITQGQVPTMDILEGVVILIAGVCLITPGFFTDILGLLSLTPILRRLFLFFFIRRHISAFQRTHAHPPNAHQANAQNQPPQARVIEGEYRREDT